MSTSGTMKLPLMRDDKALLTLWQNQLAHYLEQGGNDVFRKVLSLGFKSLPATELCLLWNSPELLIVEPSDAIPGVLTVNAKRTVFPWLQAQAGISPQALLTIDSTVLPATTAPPGKVLPLFDHEQALSGMLVMLPRRGSETAGDSTFSNLAGFIQQLQHDNIDPVSGLPVRSSFLRRIHHWMHRQSPLLATLLNIRLDTVSMVRQVCGDAAAESAFKGMLAFIRIRLRHRDIAGSPGQDSIAVLLKRCSESDAIQVQAEIRQALQDFSFSCGATHFTAHCHINTVTFGARVSLAELDEALKRLEHFDGSGEVCSSAPTRTNPPKASVIQLKTPVAAKTGKDNASLRNTSAGSASFVTAPSALHDSVRAVPGVSLLNPGLVYCHKLLNTGSGPAVHQQQLGDRQRVTRVLMTLSGVQRRNVSDVQRPVLVIPLSRQGCTDSFLDWIEASCRRNRIPAADLCLCFSETGLMQIGSQAITTLGTLTRAGFRLMVQCDSIPGYAATLSRRVNIDLVELRSEVLDNAAQLVEPVKLLHTQGARIACSGLDSEANMVRAKKSGVDIGYGRACGRSVDLGAIVTSESSTGSPQH